MLWTVIIKIERRKNLAFKWLPYASLRLFMNSSLFKLPIKRTWPRISLLPVLMKNKDLESSFSVSSEPNAAVRLLWTVANC